jgi:hypothetical protein
MCCGHGGLERGKICRLALVDSACSAATRRTASFNHLVGLAKQRGGMVSPITFAALKLGPANRPLTDYRIGCAARKFSITSLTRCGCVTGATRAEVLNPSDTPSSIRGLDDAGGAQPT